MTRADRERDDALRVVLCSRNPARFRLLTVVCGHNNHRLVVVYQTRLGPVGVMDMLTSGGRSPTTFSGQMLDAPIPATCRCRTVTLPSGWVREQLGAGRRRVVAP